MFANTHRLFEPRESLLQWQLLSAITGQKGNYDVSPEHDVCRNWVGSADGTL